MFQMRRESLCRNGHALTSDNLLPAKDGARRCRACRVRYDAEVRRATRRAERKPKDTSHGGHDKFRRNRLGTVLARGFLDYDVPVVRRCTDCAQLYAAPLASPACPHCQTALALGAA